MRISLVAALAVLAPPMATAQRVETGFLDRTATVAGQTYKYQVYVPAAYVGSTQRWPAILFLHGAGERGSDGLLQTNVGLPFAIRQKPAAYPAIVVIPQVATDSSWVGTFADVAIAALDQAQREFHLDSTRIYVTGLSLGGNGTWNLAYRYPGRFAAIAPICSFITALEKMPPTWRLIVPADSGDAFAAIARRVGRTPTWIFHGEMDPVVPVEQSRRAADALKAAGANVRYTEFMGGGHNVWDEVYGSKQFQDWLFAQRRATK